MSKTFHTQPQIIVDKGKIIRLNKPRCIERDFNFSQTVKKAMIDLAKSDPLSFMELYLMLTDDEEFFKMASEIYEEYIDKNKYPYEIIKILRHQDFNPVSVLDDRSGIINEFTIGEYHIQEVKGFVNSLDYPAKDQYTNVTLYNFTSYRADLNFYPKLQEILNFFIANDIKEFMRFYSSIKNDEIVFNLADNIRKKKLQNTINLLTVE